MKIVVIGAGSIGANIAYRLAAEGAEVVVIEASRPAAGTSSASIAWLASYPQVSWQEDPGRARLRRTVNDQFDALEAELGTGWLHWTSTLTWAASAERAKYSSDFDLCRERGLPLQMLNATEARGLAPQVQFQDDDQVIWEPRSGWVDAPLLIRLLLQHVVDLGGEILSGHPVVRIDRDGRSITAVHLSNGRRIEADAIVNAAGSWGAHIAALAGLAIPIDLVPGLMVYTGPVAAVLPTQVINAPTWLCRPDPSGGLAIHWRGEALTAIHGRNGISAQAVLDDIAQLIPALRGATPSGARIGIRPIPPGGPVIGQLPWLEGFYLALSHGGIGWGPIWARLAARELLHQQTSGDLEGMRPERFYTGAQTQAQPPKSNS